MDSCSFKCSKYFIFILSLSQTPYSHWNSFLHIMRAIIFLNFVVLFLHIMHSLVGASSRHLTPPNDYVTVSNQGKIQHSPSSLEITSHITSNQLQGSEKGSELEEKSSENMKEMKKIGSKPPSCEHKCYGCMPCEAIQVPTTSNRVWLQYTNYEPEGWKCKCGPVFYSP